ncbi:hypothetical protein HPAKL86_04230 [Helicobacter pylori Aklavik86]|uniref:DUF4868 domain-containing protein n=2 Tax=Helicobacter pylori TaxID=210 RepID=K7Z1F0_HELPX|nr:hypothetical protein HPAKL86_04230 [Helicobacter pylori Aklavik86]
MDKGNNMLENGLNALIKQKDRIIKAYDMGIKNDEELKENPFFAEIDLNARELIEFKGNEDTHPREEHNEWFVIRDSDLSFFERIKECLKNYDRAKPHFKDLKFFAFVYNGFMINIQKITPKHVIEKRLWAFLDFNEDEVQYQCNLYKNGVELGNHIDAVINLKENAIYFRKFEILSALDDRFAEFYKEATEKEFNTFIDKMRKTLKGGIEINIGYDKIKPINLKKINLMLKKEGENNQSKLDIFLNLHDKDKLKNYAKDFGSPLYINGGFKVIQENKDMTNLLKILNEDYYLTYITQKKRESHSSVAVNKKG